jgi:hypothetical protein
MSVWFGNEREIDSINSMEQERKRYKSYLKKKQKWKTEHKLDMLIIFLAAQNSQGISH